MRTLVLDNTYFPVKIISWQKAMILLFTNRAEIVTQYDDKKIQGVTNTFTLPKILRLYNKHKSEKKVRFTRQNLFFRDSFRCQYCRIKLPPNKLTLDHVRPQSQGGKTNWENLVACCSECNSKKADKSLEQVHMKLLKKPTRPKWSPQLCLKLKKTDPIDWHDWFPQFISLH